jgi:pyrimidine-nucleoside phosphorylase
MTYHVPSLIEQKRDGGTLTADALTWLMTEFSAGRVPDYQLSALAMAIFFRGMSDAETADLTLAMLESGEQFSWPTGHPLIVDKHSTGGIGDKTSLILAPLLACDGAWVPMISGRGLGITGGTLDKLESIPGFRVGLTLPEAREQIERLGVVMMGQTATLCPADKKLYALRDVTATVPSQPLIVASIMSKKLAERLDRLMLDVKYGRGAFMKTRAAAMALAEAMVAVGRARGVETLARLTPMDHPLGESVGNALEVHECHEVLQGRGPADLITLTLDLAEPLAPHADRAQLHAWLRDGTAWAKWQALCAAQGGDLAAFAARDPAPIILEMTAPTDGPWSGFCAQQIGQSAIALGAGRSRAEDVIDFAVGFDRLCPPGRLVHAGEVVGRIHARTREQAESAFRLHVALRTF